MRSGSRDVTGIRAHAGFVATLVDHPVLALLAATLAVAAIGLCAPLIERDTSSDAYMDPAHPARVSRDRIEEVFGLKDPVVIVVVQEKEGGVFNPGTLGLVEWLTEEVRNLPGVDFAQVSSLSTEKSIIGADGELVVDTFLENGYGDEAAARRVRDIYRTQRIYHGALVSRDETATVVVAELLDQTVAETVASDVQKLIDRAPKSDERLLVAGEAVTRQYIGTYGTRDTSRLNPITLAIIMIMLFIAHRTVAGVLLPLCIIVGTSLVTVGVMGATGGTFFGITAGLPVILIGISVADAIHVLSTYYETGAGASTLSPRDRAIKTVSRLWRPISITTITTVAGFASLAPTSSMPPLREFGVYAAVGTVAALLLTLIVLPAALVILSPRQSPAYGTSGRPDVFGRLTAALGLGALRRPRAVVALGLGTIALVGVAGVMRLEVEDDFITYFKPTETVFLVDKELNERFDGSRYLDIMLEGGEPDTFYSPDLLRRVEGLQDFLLSLPHVNGTSSITDALKLINRAMFDGEESAYDLPRERKLVAQYLLLYAMSGAPDDFEELIDTGYRMANVRARLDTGRYTVARDVVRATEVYLDEHFEDLPVDVVIGGRVNQSYHWTDVLREEHGFGVALALALVWFTTSLLFRSPVGGLLALLPVATSMLFVYATMGLAGIWFRLSTSMFAAISVGVTVDFSVHMLSRLRELVRDEGLELEDAFKVLFPTTGRALFFNFATIGVGFGVMGAMASTYQLVHFGWLVCVCISAAYVGSITLLPSLITLLRPRFIVGPDRKPLDG